MNWLDWIGGWLNREAEFPFLERYIEEEVRRPHPSDGASMWGWISAGIAFFSGVTFAFADVAVGVPLILLSPLIGVGAAFTVSNMAQKRTDPLQRELDKKRKSLRGFVQQLRTWKNMRMLRFKLQGGLGDILEVGARCWLQTRYGLDEVLSGPRDNPVFDTSTRVMRAMDAGMTKLIDVACDSVQTGLFLTPSFDAARGVAEHMVALAREADRISAKHQTEEERKSLSATDELRAALAECRGLDEAHRELDRIHESLRH
ncbi:MAG: hypothetical protein ABIV13_01235 [Fimbriimonadales bacterium]